MVILDNLESISGEDMATMNTLPKGEHASICSFLGRLTKVQTRIVLGSRGRKDWLVGVFGENVHQLPGLDPESQSVLALKNFRKMHT